MCYSVTHVVTSSQSPRVGTGGASSTDDALLDAARASILAVGWRRTTLTDVARRAGVSRMTIYRRWPDMQTLLGDLMTREWSGLVDDAADDRRQPARRGSPTGSPRRWPRCATTSCSRKIVDVDPELLLPYLLDRRGRTQDALLALLEAAHRRGPAGRLDPRRRPGPARPLGAARGLRLRAVRADDDRRPARRGGASTRELRPLVERYLARMTATSGRAAGHRPRPPYDGRASWPRPPTAGPSTCSSSASASPAPASRSTPPPAGCRWSPSTPTTSPSAPRGGAPSSCTAGCATSPTGRSASPTRAPSSAAS